MRAYHAGDFEHTDRLWENLQAIWSQAFPVPIPTTSRSPV
jgi:hypothetical protein